MNFQKFAIMAMLMNCIGSNAARAHSWYPKSCCSDSDCTVADSMFVDQRGDNIVIAGSNRIVVPHGLRAQPSLDENIHICFSRSRTEDTTAVYCLFLPGQA